MEINVSAGRFLNDHSDLPPLVGNIKCRVEDFQVFEMPDPSNFINPAEISTVFPRICDSDIIIIPENDTLVDQGPEPDIGEYMKNLPCFRDIEELNEWIHAPKIPAEHNIGTKIIFAAPEFSNRRVVYEYLKSRFPFCRAEKYSDGDDFLQYAVVADTSLIPLRDAGLSLADVIQIYLFIAAGPLTEGSARGITVGRGLDRPIRTEVYKCLGKVCQLLDCKTLDDSETGAKKQQLFWRRSVRERMQKQAERALASSKRRSTGIPQGALASSPVNDGNRFILPDGAAAASCISAKRSRDSSEVESGPSVSNKKSRIGSSINPIPANSSLATIKVPRFIKFVLVKNNVEHSEAIRRLADAMRYITDYYTLSPEESMLELKASGLFDKSYLHSFSFSGTKDKRGVTAQCCCLEVLPSWINKKAAPLTIGSSILNSLSEEYKRYIRIAEAAARCLLRVDCKGVSLFEYGQREGIHVGNLSYTHTGCNLGEHWGNRFDIVIRNLSPTRTKIIPLDKELGGCLLCTLRNSVLPSLDNENGFPNFFGTQRFGLVPDQHVEIESPVQIVSDVTDRTHLDTSSLMDFEENYVEDNESILTCSVMPLAPRIGKHLIQLNFRCAAHSIILGNDYLYDQEVNMVTEVGHFYCVMCSQLKDETSESISKKRLAVKKARECYATGGKPSTVLKLLPSYLTKEKWLLQGLIRHCGDKNALESATYGRRCTLCGRVGAFDEIKATTSMGGEQDDYMRAIETIPHSVRTLWVHAYGSWLWNKVADYRIFHCLAGSPRSSLLGGDLVRNPKDGTVHRYAVDLPTDGVKCDLSSLLLPLFGSNVIFPGGETGQFYKRLLRDEGFSTIDIFCEHGKTWQSFYLDPAPGLPKGAYRNIIQFPADKTKIESADAIQSCQEPVFANATNSTFTRQCANCASTLGKNDLQSSCDIRFCFGLPAGSYATVFLREVLGCDKMLL